MKQLVIFLLIFTSLYSAEAQNDAEFIDSSVDEFIMTLPVASAATMFSAKRYCKGSVKMFILADGSRCVTKGDYIETYLVYKQDNSVWIKKFDNCGPYKKIPLEDPAVFKVFVSNSTTLVSEEVKPYKTAQANTQPLARTKVYRCHRTFTFYVDGQESVLHYSLYDLSNDSMQANINYEHNNNLNTVALDKMLDPIIAAAEENNSFKRN